MISRPTGKWERVNRDFTASSRRRHTGPLDWHAVARPFLKTGGRVLTTWIESVPRKLTTYLAGAALMLLVPAGASAQVTPAAGYTPPHDTPKVNVRVTIFTNYVRNDEPTGTGTDGNTVHVSA